MGNIVLLDDLTINKIAAGEVIERPASVVKELVENAIDAGATNINIETKNGGISYIRVTDNGKGIMPDDMEIAFERHATSKIRVAEDLETVKSMGFRGEALASIAAIAKVTMKSKTVNNDIGYEVIAEGGNVLEKQETGCPNGTSITVENLFYNTPVRYKFLKKDFTEAGYIEDAITRIALIHPEIAIKLVSSGKTIIQTPGNSNMQSVVYGIYGKDIAENILDVDYLYDDIRITGVVGKPVIARSNRTNQLFFVNKRYIKDKTLTSSAEQAFKGMITIGKFGFLVLNIELNPEKVDVNVHPAKLEVRFEEEQKVFKAIYHAIKETLLKNDLVSNPQTAIEKINNDSDEIDFSKQVNTNNNEKLGLFSRNNITDISKFNTSKLESIPTKDDQENNFNEIMGRMAQMQKEVNEFKENSYNLNIKQENKIEEKSIDNEIVENNFTEEIKNVSNILNDANDSVDSNNLTEEITQVIEVPKQEKEDSYNGETIVITNEMKQEIMNNASKIEETQVISTNEISQISEEIENEEEVKVEEPEKKFEDMYETIFGTAPIADKQVAEEPEEYKLPQPEILEAENISVFDTEENSAPKYKYIGIAFSTYIIVELNKELYIIDQHAAHERIMYEKVKANYYKDEDKDSQLMLLPDVITLTHKEMDVARENMEMFEKAGFMLEEFGENTIKLSGVPNICIDLDTEELFLETLDEINTVARTAKQEIEEKFIATVACKAAVKANMALTEEEVNNLMDELLKLPNPFTCPHGRPTAIRMTKTDIEKKFSRR